MCTCAAWPHAVGRIKQKSFVHGKFQRIFCDYKVILGQLKRYSSRRSSRVYAFFTSLLKYRWWDESAVGGALFYVSQSIVTR